MIKAIDTYYNRNYFRSRLEARWAVFFDLLKIRWRYEPTGFELGGGKRYLPDFYFPDYDLYGEVKPEPVEDSRWIDFVRLSEKRLIVFTDLPHMQTSKLYRLKNNSKNEVEIAEVIPFAFLRKPDYGLFFFTGGYKN